MKTLKLSILALTLGMFATSCDTTTTENTVVEGDTTTVVTPAPVVEPTVVMPMDSNNMATPVMEPATTTPAAPGTPAAPAEMK